MKIDLNKIIGRENMSFILIEMNKNGKKRYASDIAKELSKSSSNVLRLIRKLIKMDLIKKAKEGRRVIITLTEKGKKVTEKLSELKEILEKE